MSICAALDHPEAVRLAAQEQVIHHRELRDHVELLVNNGNTERLGVAGRADRDGLAVDENAASICAIRAREDFHQGRLTCAVLADEGVNLAARDGEIDAVEHPNRAERLADAFHRRFHRLARCASPKITPEYRRTLA
jgi:hypothetical protein